MTKQESIQNEIYLSSDDLKYNGLRAVELRNLSFQ